MVMKTVVARIDDLMFVSQLSHACQTDGFALKVIPKLSDLPHKADLLVIDLTVAATDWAPLVSQANLRGVPSLGFVGHVHTDLIAEAHDLGVTLVVPNGEFSARASSLMHHLMHEHLDDKA